jgi:5,10-methylenetetrahydromethanopterin reductase
LPARAVTECIELSRRLWLESKAFSYHGQQIQFLEDCLDFKPPSSIPIYVAARGPKMLAVAAQLADTVLIGSFVEGVGLDYALKTIREAEVGRSTELPPVRKACWIYLSVSPDSEAAQRGAARGLALALRSSHKLLTEVGYEIPADLLDFVEKSRHSWNADEVDWVVARLPRALIDDLTVAGDARECAAKLRRLQDRGIEEVAILPFAPAGGNVRDMVELLFTEVAPPLAN